MQTPKQDRRLYEKPLINNRINPEDDKERIKGR